jgi:predicted DNA-binding WGR domain protein
MSAVHLIRIDQARYMRGFYRLDVQPDLFGGFALVKEWGRIGARCRMMDELHATEVLAAAAMQHQADRKRRRGYRPLTEEHRLSLMTSRPTVCPQLAKGVIFLRS